MDNPVPSQRRLAATQTQGIGMIVFDPRDHTGLSFLMQEHTTLPQGNRNRWKKLCSTAPNFQIRDMKCLQDANANHIPAFWSVNSMSWPLKRPTPCIKLSFVFTSDPVVEPSSRVVECARHFCSRVHVFFFFTQPQL